MTGDGRGSELMGHGFMDGVRPRRPSGGHPARAQIVHHQRRVDNARGEKPEVELFSTWMQVEALHVEVLAARRRDRMRNVGLWRTERRTVLAHLANDKVPPLNIVGS